LGAAANFPDCVGEAWAEAALDELSDMARDLGNDCVSVKRAG